MPQPALAAEQLRGLAVQPHGLADRAAYVEGAARARPAGSGASAAAGE